MLHHMLSMLSVIQFKHPADHIWPQIFPSGRSSRSVGPGIEIRDNPAERRRRGQELDDMTSLE